MKKKTLSVLLAMAMAVSLAGCGGSSANETTAATTASTETKAAETTKAEAEGETEAQAGNELPNFEGQKLTVSTFSFNAELLQKNVYDPFMEATGCELIVEGGKNAERVTKIKEAPGSYDVVIIGDAFVVDLIDEGLVEPLDSSHLTNLDALYENAKAPFGS